MQQGAALLRGMESCCELQQEILKAVLLVEEIGRSRAILLDLRRGSLEKGEHETGQQWAPLPAPSGPAGRAADLAPRPVPPLPLPPPCRRERPRAPPHWSPCRPSRVVVLQSRPSVVADSQTHLFFVFFLLLLSPRSLSSRLRFPRLSSLSPCARAASWRRSWEILR